MLQKSAEIVVPVLKDSTSNNSGTIYSLALRATDGPREPKPGPVPVAARGRRGQAHAVSAAALPAAEPGPQPAYAPATPAAQLGGPAGHPAGLNLPPFSISKSGRLTFKLTPPSGAAAATAEHPAAPTEPHTVAADREPGQQREPALGAAGKSKKEGDVSTACNQSDSSPGLWAATAASYCTSRPGELPKLIATEYRTQGAAPPCRSNWILHRI